MSMDLSLIRDIAATQRFQAETVEKVLRLEQILVEFHRHPASKRKLVLKGGTALNLFYLDLDRLSVDIDLNYIGQVDRQAMVSERPVIVKAVEQICGALGYQVQRGAGDHALAAWSGFAIIPQCCGKRKTLRSIWQKRERNGSTL